MSGAAAGRRVLVVGGGIAGLVAAHRLQAADVRATLLEARPHVGGKLGGAAAAGAPEVVPRRAPALWGLLGELGLAAETARLEIDELGELGRRGLARRPLRTRAFLGRHPLRGLHLRRLQTLVDWLAGPLDPDRPELEVRLDDRSVADLCRLYLGRRPLEHLFAPLLELGFGLDAQDTSRQLLLGWLGAGGDAELDLVCGLERLPEALAQGLADVRTGRRTVGVLPGGSGVRLDSGERIDADAVVLAVAAAEVAHLVPDLCAAEREVLGRCAQVAVLQLVVPAGSGSSRPELPRAMWLPRARGGALAGALEASPGTSAAPGQRVLIARREHVAALAERPDERVAERLLLEARRIDPDAAAAVLADEACVRRFERPAFRPGQLRGAQRLRDEARARPQRRLFLCGDYLVGPHVAGEVASGERAARDALEALESLEALEAPRAPGALTSV